MTRQVSAWGGALWLSPNHRKEALDAARELEELGYTRLWTSGGFGEGLPKFTKKCCPRQRESVSPVALPVSGMPSPLKPPTLSAHSNANTRAAFCSEWEPATHRSSM